MKPRKLVITVEVTTDLRVEAFRDLALMVAGFRLVPDERPKVNVVKPKSKKGGK